jgi:folate-binding protein YgfZ
VTPQEQAAAVRRGAGLFRLDQRALLEVSGADRSRWLDGMLSNEVRSLGPERSGCAALALTRTGRVVADLHVLWRPEALWLELDAAAAGPTRGHLEKFIIADAVRLEDRSSVHARLALEGPAAAALLGALGAAPPPPADACLELELAGVPLLLAAWGWSGEPAFQLFAPRARGGALAEALLQAGAAGGLVEAGAEALEILRIEAGVPRYGAELDESVLPDEARLGAAVSTRKGCYTGQEVVARLRSQGQPSHFLVGLRAEGDAPLAAGSEIRLGDTRVGEVTSACVSPAAGSIALGFVRRPHQEPGTRVLAGGCPARVAALPFAGPGAPAG